MYRSLSIAPGVQTKMLSLRVWIKFPARRAHPTGLSSSEAPSHTSTMCLSSASLSLVPSWHDTNSIAEFSSKRQGDK